MGIPNPILYLKWLTGSQKFVILIRCEINFGILWYSVIFAANLYESIFVWSSDILNLVFMNVVMLVFTFTFANLILCCNDPKPRLRCQSIKIYHKYNLNQSVYLYPMLFIYLILFLTLWFHVNGLFFFWLIIEKKIYKL